MKSRIFCAVVFVLGCVAAQEPAPGAAAARRADIAAFREHFLAVDRSFAPDARAAAVARLAALETAAAKVGQAYFELELARITALADNGHTNGAPVARCRRTNRVGVRFVPFGEDFYVLRARAAEADLLGARLVAIDARSIAELREIARTLTGGLPSFRDRFAGFLLESPEQLHALNVIAAADAATYRFERSGGATVERRLVAEPADPGAVRAGSDRWLFPQRLDGEEDSRALLAVERAPWALQDPTERFRWRAAPEIDALVIELRQNADAAGYPVGRFLDEARRAIREQRPQNLVLDMRVNGGGDLNTTRDFVQALPDLVPGRIFVLTSPWTFSAAISSVGYLKQSAPSRVTLVGEHVGDRLEFFAEGSRVSLPNSGAMFSYATERHDYRNGCRGLTDCHGAVVRHPIAVPTLAPEIPAPWTIEAYREGKDPALEAVAAALRPNPA